MSWRSLRFKLYVATPFVMIPLIGGLVFYDHCRSLPDANQQIGVKATDFKAPVKEAMNIWNRAAGCTIFVPGEDLLFGSTDGEPCGLAFHPGIEDGHSAGSYKCADHWEIHVEKPGDLRTQTCIAIHEFGHVLGLEDTNDESKAMYTEWCPPDGQLLWPADSESKEVGKRFCP